MTRTEITKLVNKAISNGSTVIISPESLKTVWTQKEIEDVPNISAEEEINGRLIGVSVRSSGKRSSVLVVGY